MIIAVENIANQVKSLNYNEFEEFITWLADYSISQMDEWESEIENDLKSGGRLDKVIRRVRKDIKMGKVKPLDEILYNS